MFSNLRGSERDEGEEAVGVVSRKGGILLTQFSSLASGQNIQKLQRAECSGRGGPKGSLEYDTDQGGGLVLPLVLDFALRNH